jgi:hypothetical protein
MKQHITVAQFNELTKKGRDKLWNWWKPRNGDMFLDFEIGYGCLISEKPETFKKKQRFPLLTIGQMIEFLDEQDKILCIDYGSSYVSEMGQTNWRVIFDESQYEDDELCDALWEAVKEVLEK